MPVNARLDAEEVHEEVYFAAPFARAWARAMIGSIRVSLSSHKFGRKPVQMGLCIRLPELHNLVNRGEQLRKESSNRLTVRV